MNTTRTKTILAWGLCAAMAGAGLGAPGLVSAQSATTGVTHSEQNQSAFDRLYRAERVRAATAVSLERALVAHAEGTIDAVHLQRVRDADAQARFAYDAALAEYRALETDRPEVPMPANIATTERNAIVARRVFLDAVRDQELAKTRAANGVEDLDVQRIDGTELARLQSEEAAARLVTTRTRAELAAAWAALDQVYSTAIASYHNVDAERIAAAERAAAERAAAERAEAARVAEARAAAERAAEARRVADARLAAERAAEARRAANARAEAERARAARVAEARAAAERAAEARRAANARAEAERAQAARVAEARRAANARAEAARVAQARAAAARAARDAEARRAAEARTAWERARRGRATVPAATAANGQGSVVVRPTASAPGKGGEVCPVTGVSSGVSAGYSATVRVSIR